MEKLVVSQREARAMLNISSKGMNHLLVTGAIKSWKTTGGQWRIPVSEINNYIERRLLGERKN